MKVDLVSLEILTKLLKDGRATHQSIAEDLSFSRPAIHRRINKLEEEGIIEGYSANVDYSKIGLTIDAFMLLNMHTLNYNKAIKEIMSLSGQGIFIQEVFRITGNQCIILRLRASSPDRLRQLHDDILELEGLIETNTMLILQSEENIFNHNYSEDNIKR